MPFVRFSNEQMQGKDPAGLGQYKVESWSCCKTKTDIYIIVDSQ